MTDDRLRKQLRDHGLRATQARVQVLQILIEAERPLSHAEVFELVAERGFDRATVYRNLTDLVEVGLARRNDLGDHVWRFEISEDAHPHFVCTECGTVECLPETSVQVKGVSRVTEVHVRGVCGACD